jgi:hypothetical protein
MLWDPSKRLSIREGFRVAGGECEPSAPIRLRQYYGRLWDDHLWAAEGIDVVSARVVAALQDGGVTGWRTFDVSVESKKGMAVEGYKGLAVIGRCGPVDDSLSEWSPAPPVNGVPVAPWKGEYFDASTWDGSDIFRPPGTRSIMITRKVRDILATIGATNTYAVTMSEFRRILPGRVGPPSNQPA